MTNRPKNTKKNNGTVVYVAQVMSGMVIVSLPTDANPNYTQYMGRGGRRAYTT